jgi:hypothetical protein
MNPSRYQQEVNVKTSKKGRERETRRRSQRMNVIDEKNVIEPRTRNEEREIERRVTENE